MLLYALLTGPTSASMEVSDSTQKVTEDEHKELISKLEILEERVEKLESENKELKKESEKVSDNKEDAEITDKESEIEGEDAKKLVPKSDDSLAPVKDDKADPIVNQQPAVSLKPDAPVDPQPTHEHKQALIQDKTKSATKDQDLLLDPVKKEPHKEHSVSDDRNYEGAQQKEHSRLDHKIPDLHVSKDTNLAPQDDSKKLHKKDHLDKLAKHEDDKALLENPVLKSDLDHDHHDIEQKVDLPHIEQDGHQITSDQNKIGVDHQIGKRFVDENLKNQEMPKLDTGGVLSRDLLHDNKQNDEDDTQLATESLQVQTDEAGRTQTSAPPSAQNDTSTKSCSLNVVKRDILSLKPANDSETQSLNNG